MPHISLSNIDFKLIMSIVNAVTHQPDSRPFQPPFRIKESGRINCHIIIIYKNTA